MEYVLAILGSLGSVVGAFVAGYYLKRAKGAEEDIAVITAMNKRIAQLERDVEHRRNAFRERFEKALRAVVKETEKRREEEPRAAETLRRAREAWEDESSGL